MAVDAVVVGKRQKVYVSMPARKMVGKKKKPEPEPEPESEEEEEEEEEDGMKSKERKEKEKDSEIDDEEEQSKRKEKEKRKKVDDENEDSEEEDSEESDKERKEKGKEREREMPPGNQLQAALQKDFEQMQFDQGQLEARRLIVEGVRTNSGLTSEQGCRILEAVLMLSKREREMVLALETEELVRVLQRGVGKKRKEVEDPVSPEHKRIRPSASVDSNDSNMDLDD
jgi:hypothetical protein